MFGKARIPRTAAPAQAADRRDDDELLAALRANAAEGFAAVFARYHKLVYATALRFLRDPAEAEEVMQTVFLEAFQKLPQFDPSRGTLKVWLLQFAYSRSMNRRNYLMVRRLHGDGYRNEPFDDGELWTSERTPQQESSCLTHELLKELPEAQRATMEMVFFEGLTFGEIAERRGESFSAVRHHYYRGLTRLRELHSRGPTPVNPGQRAGMLRQV